MPHTPGPKATPGPWKVNEGTGYISSQNHGYVAIRTPFREDAFRGKHGQLSGTPVIPTTELLANARLIAAAPDLLAALDDVAAAPDDPELWLGVIAAAIARAEGE